MPNFIRIHYSGGTFFFTVVTNNRYPLLAHAQSRRILRHAWIDEMRARPFVLEAICLLPDHLHFMIRLPEGDHDYSIRISAIKARFTRMFLKENSGEGFGAGFRRKGERSVWQHRFWEHTIRDEEDFQRHVDYIHYNPVKHGLVSKVQDWPWSSFHRYVRKGIYPPDWGGDLSMDVLNENDLGE